VQEASQILINLPLKEFQLIGSYYLGWSLYRNGQYEHAEQLLQSVVNQVPAAYQSRAMLSLAGIEAIRQDYDSELKYYVESARASQDLSTTIEAYRGIAIVKAKEGYHSSSLKDFEHLLSLSVKCEPVVREAYLNSYAVELGEAGRIYEARNISRIVLASPFAFAYPEWQETAQDLKESRRSFVAMNRMNCHNILTMSAIEHGKTEQEIKQTNSIQAPLSLDKADDNLLEFPHLVDVEKLEKESEERFRA
jgi:tetratricopeptide (TPR) repeat protein